MKKIISILFLLFSLSVFSQSKLDSLVLVKVNDYRVSLGLNKVVFDTVCYKAAKCQSTYLANIYIASGMKKYTMGHGQDVKGFETSVKRLNAFGKYKFLKTAEICNFEFINFNVNDTLGYNKLATKILELWKSSPAHNQAIIDPNYKFAANYSYEIILGSGFKNVNHYETFNTMVFIDRK
jgi:uncharacterized protein YkwD